MATYETNIQAGQALSKKLHDTASQLRAISNSNDPVLKARADELRSEIGKIQNQIMMLGNMGAIGGGIAKGVTSTITAIPDLAVMAYDYFRNPKLSELVTGKQPTKTLSEWMTPGVESVSQEQAGLFGVSKGVGSSVGLGKTMTALNIGANWFDEYLAKGTPMAQTALAAGSLLEAGRRGVYSFLNSRSSKKLLADMPAEDVNTLRQFMVKGQDTTDPVLAGRIKELRSNPKYAELFDQLEEQAKNAVLKGTKVEVNASYPAKMAGKDIAGRIESEAKLLKENVKLAGAGQYKKAAELAGDTPMVVTDNTQKVVADLIAQYKKSELPDSQKTVTFLESLQSSLTDGAFQKKMTVPQLQAWLSDFGKKAAGGESLITDVSVGTQKVIASKIFGGLKDDLNVLAKSSDQTEKAVGGLLKGATENYKVAVGKFNDFQVQALPASLQNKSLASIDTETLLKEINNLSNEQRNYVSSIIKNTEPEAWNRVKQYAYDDFIRSARSTEPGKQGTVDLQKLVSKWNSLNPDEQAKLAVSMDTTVADFGGRMKDADSFFKYNQKFAGKEDASKLSVPAAEQAGYILSGGQYLAAKASGAVASLWNRVKGGLSEEQTLNVLMSPETRGLFKEATLSPRSAQTLTKIDDAFKTNAVLTSAYGLNVGTRAAAQQATNPEKQDVTLEPVTPKLNLEGIDIGPVEPTAPKLNLEGINISYNPADIETQIRAEAKNQGLEQYADLFVRQARAESNFDPYATSKKGAGGVFQLMPGTAGDLKVTDVYDPVQNISGGIRYMGQLLNKYQNDPTKALAAYNWGMGNVDRQGLETMPAETRDYLARILG